MKNYIVYKSLLELRGFMICFVHQDCSPRNLIYTLTGLLVAGVLVACGCMAYAIKKSFDEYGESDISTGWTEQPATCAVNGTINFVLAFFVALTAFKSKGDGSMEKKFKNCPSFWISRNLNF